MTKPEPARYRTTNWKSYNDAPEATRFAADLAGQGHGVYGDQGGATWPTARVLRRCGPVLLDGEGTL